MSKIEHIPCGEFVNESERKAVEQEAIKLNNKVRRIGTGFSARRFRA